jgi:hypothetical protein
VRARYAAREIYIPKGVAEIETRKEKFDRLNAFVRLRNGWLVSIPGHPIIVLECLPGSSLPDELRDAGYMLERAEPYVTERIIANNIIERLELSSSGALIAATEGSTRPIATTVVHSGITRVMRFTFSIG